MTPSIKSQYGSSGLLSWSREFIELQTIPLDLGNKQVLPKFITDFFKP